MKNTVQSFIFAVIFQVLNMINFKIPPIGCIILGTSYSLRCMYFNAVEVEVING